MGTPRYKKMLVLGATGKTGKELIDIALARGHEVTAFVRSPAKITRRDKHLTVVKGDPRNAEELCMALPGHEVVLSALGPTPKEAMTRSTLLQDCASTAVTAMKRTGVHRLLVVSSAMLFPGGGPVAAFLRLLLRPHVHDLKAMEERIKAASIEWTIARPPRLIRATDEGYRAQPGALASGATLLSSVMSWRAVAAFMLDSAENDRHVREIVGICR
jgi:putative NADH-flavin reductase